MFTFRLTSNGSTPVPAYHKKHHGGSPVGALSTGDLFQRIILPISVSSMCVIQLSVFILCVIISFKKGESPFTKNQNIHVCMYIYST